MNRRTFFCALFLCTSVIGGLTRPINASAAPYGAVLVPGSAWAGQFATLGDLNVYSNGTDLSSGQYQCTELASRWLALRYGEVRSGLGMAADWWTNGPTARVPLYQHPNGGADRPQFGDIIVFGATSYDTTGHVSVVTGSTATTVSIVEQNWSSTAGSATLPISATTMPARWGLPVLGWLRPTPSQYVPASSGPGGYSVDGYGGLQPWGSAPAMAASAYWPGWDIARGIAKQAGHNAGYVLDGYGGLHPFGGAPAESITAYWPGWDIARGVALRSDGTSGYVLDGFGGLHPFGGAPAVAITGYWPGWDIAKSVALRADGVSGWVLDGYGGLHAFGGAPAGATSAYWPGWNIARGVAVIPGSDTGYVLDGYGALHPFNGAPNKQPVFDFPGSNLADGVVVTTGSGPAYVGYRNGAVAATAWGSSVPSSVPGLPIDRGIS